MVSDTDHLNSHGRWINTCNACPHIEIRETYAEYLAYCSKERGKKIECTIPIPSWCPLGHKTEEKYSRLKEKK
jgi:hypothetical protein